MEFFGMGLMEILIILVVGLIALGPAKLPQVARNLGKGISALRKATTDLTAEVTKEFDDLDKE
jgi:Tat protein translocase TatB subunit